MPHASCLRDPGLVAIHAASDALIATAYFVIPVALVLMLRSRRDLAFPWMFGLFGLFILACGTTHLLSIWTLWHPIYRLEGLVKAITALASVSTAFLLFRILPQVTALPSPAQLSHEITERRTAEDNLRRLNVELEERVRERTETLERTNERLQAANLSLQDSEVRYRTLVEAMPQFVWSARNNGYCEYLSRQWVEYTGRTEEQQLGDRWLTSLHPEDRALTASAWRTAVESGQEYDLEFRIRRHDGAYRWFKTRGVPLKNDAGTILRWLGTCTDIDTEKQSALTLEKHSRHLEDLAFATAHHLQEPIRVLLLQAQQVVRRHSAALNENGHTILKRLTGNAEQLQQLLRDVLTYSEANIANICFGSADTTTVLRCAIDSWQSDILKANAVVTCSGSFPIVSADAWKIQEVFEHLIGNALKYRDIKRPLRIHISGTQAAEDVVFSITDNGIGIDPQFHEKVFGLFKRLHTQDEYPGTGFGLALCRRIVELHGHRMWLESNHGSGSTFYFSLRSVDAAA